MNEPAVGEKSESAPIADWLATVCPSPPEQFVRSLIRVAVFLVFTWVLWWLIARLILSLVDIVVASAVSLAVAVTATTAAMMRIYELQPFHAVGFFWNRVAARHLIMGLGLGTGSALLVGLAEWSGRWVRVEQGARQPDSLATLAFGFFILAVGAAGEELLFRGYGFQHLIRAFGPWFSIAASSALFGLAHSANPSVTRVSLINTALFGAVFGYAYWRTLDLWLPLGMHFSWNFLLATVGANVSGLRIKLTGLSIISAGSPLWSGGEYGPEASLFTTVALLAMMIFIWRGVQGRQEQGILAAPDDEQRA